MAASVADVAEIFESLYSTAAGVSEHLVVIPAVVVVLESILAVLSSLWHVSVTALVLRSDDREAAEAAAALATG